MYIVFAIISLPFFIRIILYFYHMYISYNYINQEDKIENDFSAKMLLLIPVLREQAVICKTLAHFINLNIDNSELYILIAGTNREKSDNTTIHVVESWIGKYRESLPDNIIVDYCEADDIGGDRATQLNYAVKFVRENRCVSDLNYIGVYDADSLPSCDTLKEVINSFQQDTSLGACQQPVHFVLAANVMSQKKENPVLVANALYQSTWTVISELPMWVRYYAKKNGKISKRHLYLIGHGEFMKISIYDNFQFPEYEVTDGIQLGYRLGMTNQRVKPLKEFCNDDVPHDIKSLTEQHKRWFGGCMNLLSAYNWAKDTYGINAFLQVLDGAWSQFRWAFTSYSFIICLLISYIFQKRILLFFIIMGVVYCYVIPLIAHKILPEKISVRLIDWVCLPIAIFAKTIGPSKYILNIVLRKNVKYEKVER